MRKLIVAVTAALAVLAAGSLANRAEAMPAGAGLRHAIEDTDLTDKVHCRWGYGYGCYGGYYRYSYYPRYRYRYSYYPYYYPRYRYYPRYAVAPIVIHVGPRYRWRYRYY